MQKNYLEEFKKLDIVGETAHLEDVAAVVVGILYTPWPRQHFVFDVYVTGHLDPFTYSVMDGEEIKKLETLVKQHFNG